jgi:nitrate/nitrite transport system permease protein
MMSSIKKAVDIDWQRIGTHLAFVVVGISVFLVLWSVMARNIETSLGTFPGPTEVVSQFGVLWQEHTAERDKADKFYERQEKRNAKRLAKDPDYKPKVREYTGPPTFIDQIGTSLLTVFTAFILGSLIAIPIGILIGMSENLYSAVNPLIQIFKPVSPLAWLPLVTIVISAVYTSESPWFEKSFLISVITVMLSSIWATIINTAVGVSSVDKDLLNVSRMLRLGHFTHIIKILIPSSIPMMFTGLRVSLGIAWMVLIAAEMLSQSPGLGKFVWDEFQNGSSQSMARIMVAVFTIGIIGFLLDRLIISLQAAVSWDKAQKLK